MTARRRRLLVVAFVTAALVATGTSIAATPVVATDSTTTDTGTSVPVVGSQETGSDRNASVRRVASQVVFSVPSDTVASSAANASLRVTRKGVRGNVTIQGAEITGGSYEFRRDAQEIQSTLFGPNVMTRNVQLQLSWNKGASGQYQNSQPVTTDLRTLAFTKGVSVDEARLKLSVEASGFGGRGTIPLRIDNTAQATSTTYTGTLVDNNDTTAIELSIQEAFRGNISPLGKLRFTTFPRGAQYLQASSPTGVDLRTHFEFGRNSIRSSDDGLVVDHALLFAGTEYIVDIRAGSGRYVNSLTATEGQRGGQVRIPSALWTVDGGTITVERRDTEVNTTVVLEDVALPVRSKIETTTYEDGAFRFSGEPPTGVRSVWLRHGSDIWRATNVTTTDSGLSVAPLRGNGSYQLVVLGNGGITRASATVSQQQLLAGDFGSGSGGGLGRAESLIRMLVIAILLLAGSFVTYIVMLMVSDILGGLIQFGLFTVTTLLWISIALLVGLNVTMLPDWLSGWVVVHLLGVSFAAVMTATFASPNQSSITKTGLPALLATTLGTLWLTSGANQPDIAVVAAAVVGPFPAWLLVRRLRENETTRREYGVEIKLTDKNPRGRALNYKTDIHLDQHGTGRSNTITVNGTTRRTLPAGTWTLKPGSPAPNKDIELRTNKTVAIPIPRKKVEFAVETEGGDGIGNVTVMLNADELEKSKTLQTGADGTTSTVELPADVSEATIDITHDVYTPVRSTPRTVSIENGERKEFKMVAQTGKIDATLRLDGDRAPEGVPITVKPTADSPLDKDETLEKTTDAKGKITTTAPIGTYVLEPGLPGKSTAFSQPTSEVIVEEGITNDIELRASFQYQLPADIERRVADLRTELDSVTSHPRIDMSIPEYYGSVVHAMLDMVESMPQRGKHYAKSAYAPSEVVEAILTAAERGIEAIDTAMSEKQNVDLFAACADMEPAAEGWDGSFTLSALFECADLDPGNRQSEIGRQVDEVKDRIDSELQELSEVGPAREMWTETRSLVSVQGERDLYVAALVQLGEALLEAIETLFEREQLRERMTRTVF